MCERMCVCRKAIDVYSAHSLHSLDALCTMNLRCTHPCSFQIVLLVCPSLCFGPFSSVGVLSFDLLYSETVQWTREGLMSTMSRC